MNDLKNLLPTLNKASRIAREVARTHIPKDDQLSLREIEVLQLLAQGHTRFEIAQLSTRSVGTIDKQVNSIIEKLGARNVAQAVALALSRKII